MDLDFLVSPSSRDETSETKRRRLRAKTKVDLKAWKRDVIEVLKGSPSKDRKFLRWKVYKGERRYRNSTGFLVEEGELEVLPGVSP